MDKGGAFSSRDEAILKEKNPAASTRKRLAKRVIFVDHEKTLRLFCFSRYNDPQFLEGRQPENIKVLYEKEIDGNTVKVCKVCNAQLKNIARKEARASKAAAAAAAPATEEAPAEA